MDHSDCKYYFKSSKTKTINAYSGLQKSNISKEINVVDMKCGLNPSAVSVFENQPLCQYFKEVKRK